MAVGAALGYSRRCCKMRLQQRLSKTARSMFDLGEFFNTETSSEKPPGELLYGPVQVGVQRMQLTEELRRYLMNDPSMLADQSCLEQRGFEKCVDHPDVPGHAYYEGCFHCLPGESSVEAVHPRWGHDYQKPAAPLRFRAFAESVRRANADVITCMKEHMLPGSVLRETFENDMVFADLAIQMHFGDAVDASQVKWHVDAPNSALHMAVSLQGERTLKLKVRRPTEVKLGVVDELQHPCDVYVGNPLAYEHGLEYPQATWDDRVIACQYRLLMSREDMVSCKKPAGLKGMTKIATDIVHEVITMPTLQQVEEVAEELSH